MGLELVILDVRWIISSVSKKSLWRYSWLNGRSLRSFMQIPSQLQHTEDYKVSDFILDSEWAIPQDF